MRNVLCCGVFLIFFLSACATKPLHSFVPVPWPQYDSANDAAALALMLLEAFKKESKIVVKMYDPAKQDGLSGVSLLHGLIQATPIDLGRVSYIDSEKVSTLLYYNGYEILPGMHSAELCQHSINQNPNRPAPKSNATLVFVAEPGRTYAPMVMTCQENSILNYLHWIEDWGSYDPATFASEKNISAPSEDSRKIVSKIVTTKANFKLYGKSNAPKCVDTIIHNKLFRVRSL